MGDNTHENPWFYEGIHTSTCDDGPNHPGPCRSEKEAMSEDHSVAHTVAMEVAGAWRNTSLSTMAAKVADAAIEANDKARLTCQTCGGSGKRPGTAGGIDHDTDIWNACPNPNCVDGRDYVRLLESYGLEAQHTTPNRIVVLLPQGGGDDAETG